mgnify:CR=1 FL=1
MKTALLILVLILGGASSLYARFKRTLAEDGNAADGSETQSYAGEEAGDGFFDLDRFELENDETAPAKPDEYFTYEAPKVEVALRHLLLGYHHYRHHNPLQGLRLRR